MSDENSLSYQVGKNSGGAARSAESALITLERSQKLDLLIHLIANLRQSLVICGPKGIGKTTLLEELEARKHDTWLICTIQSSENLSFEAIQNQIVKFLIRHYPEYKNQDLTTLVSSINKQTQKVVVLIHGAGKLVPGLISSLIQYAAPNECLRVVFSLTQDEVHFKSSSDSEIDDCHFIEIPPLNEKQCGIFLQNLSAKPKAAVSFNAITDRLVELVYKKTHGIPGRIISELPKMAHYKVSGGNGRLVGMVLVAVVIIIVVNVFVLNRDDENIEMQGNKAAVVLQKVEKIELTPPITYVSEVELVADESMELKKVKVIEDLVGIEKEIPLINTLLSDKNDEVKEALIKEKVELEAKQEILIDVLLGQEVKENPIVLKEKKTPVVTEIKKIVVEKPKQKQRASDDREWLLTQPKSNYTIQLMVLSSRQSIDAFLNANQGLTDQLKFFQINKRNQKYVLIYGSFKNRASAANKMKSLPAKYKKSWIRKMSAVQKRIKNNE